MNRPSSMATGARIRRARTARFHLDQPLIDQQTLTLDKRASHHISTVLRMRKGDTLVLFNGDGREHVADVLETGRRVQIHIRECLEIRRESTLSLTLLQCISRGERMDSTIRQSVELGVTRICPVSSRHSVKLEEASREARKQTHWQNIVISAVEQSGRNVLPRLDAPQSLTDCLEQTSQLEGIKLVLSPDAQDGIGVTAAEALSYIVLVGPESGLDSDELALAEHHGFQPIRLGPRVLRTETAGPCILSILQARNGDMSR